MTISARHDNSVMTFLVMILRGVKVLIQVMGDFDYNVIVKSFV